MHIYPFILGLIPCGIGIAVIGIYLNIIIGSTVVEGTLAGFGDQQTSPRGGGAVYPYLVKIPCHGELVTKQAVQFKMNWSGGPSKKTIGKKVKVYYNPHKQRVVIKGYYHSAVLVLLFIFALGIFSLLLAFGIIGPNK